VSSDPNIVERTEFERRLMDAASAERPSPELSARMAGALGIPMGPGAPPLPAAKLTSGLLPAGVIAAALGGALGLWALLRPTAEPSPQPAVHPAQAALKPAPREVEPAAAPHSPHIGVLEAPPAPVPEPADKAARPAPSPVANASKGSGESTPSVERSDLREEIRAIDAVRSALSGHDPALALSLLRAYSSKFKNGTFGQEATVLRVEALEQSGQHQKAQALSRDFQSKHPTSPLSERLSRQSSANKSN
jgi:hypothetical protein